MRRIGGLIVMGGAIESPGNVTPAAEFNIFVDPHAASVVFNARLPTVLVPLDVTHQVRLTLETLKKRLRGSRTDLARAVRVMTADLLAGRYRSDGTPMHDPLAIAAAIDRSLIGTEPMAVLVETRGVHTLGMTMTDRRPGREALTAAPTIEVATSVRAREALDLLCRRVLDPERNAAGSKTAPRRGKRVIVVGSANMDFSVRVPHLPAPGETVIGRSLGIHFGGKGANQAVAARRAGADVDLVAMLGRDPLGASYLAHLEAERNETQQIELSGREPSGAALIAVAPRGQNQISVAPGANMALGVEKMAGLAEIVDDAAVLVVQLEIPLRSVEHALRVARRRRLLTLLNPAPAAPLPERMQKLVDVLVLNEVEAAMLTGRPIATLRDARGAVRALHDAGFSRVALTLGRRGVMWTDGAGSGHQPGRPVKALDTTGAGDTFVGYLACALAERRPFADAVSSANAAAALSVARTGAQTGIPRRSEVQKYLGGATGDLGHHPQIPGGGS